LKLVKKEKDNPLKKDVFTITVKTFYGLEDALMDELNELGYREGVKLNRAVQLKGTWKDVYYLNVHLRCALTVLVQVASFRINTEQDLYDKASRIPWFHYFDLTKTFAVKGAVHSTLFKNSLYAQLLLKDAIVDSFRKEFSDRPNVNTKSPQVVFDIYIQEKEVVLSLNTSGAPLFQRGYRQETGVAPLNEVVAAGMIRLSGWDRKSTFIDPFCGSGTLLIEAALLAAGIPSCVERTHFAFKNFKSFRPDLWEEIQGEVVTKVLKLPCKIMGYDIKDEMVTKTRRNLRQLSIGRFVETSSQSFDTVKKTEDKGIIVTNPPYGERIQSDITELYGKIGTWLKHEMNGYSCWIISSSTEGFHQIGLRHTSKYRLFNGDIECSFRGYELYKGTKKGELND